MNVPIDYRISELDGRRFAVMPLEQFTELVDRAGEADALTLPHEVASRHLVDDVPLVRCGDAARTVGPLHEQLS